MSEEKYESSKARNLPKYEPVSLTPPSIPLEKVPQDSHLGEEKLPIPADSNLGKTELPLPKGSKLGKSSLEEI